MSFVVEHKIAGKKVRQIFAYKYPETLQHALKGLDVVRVWLEDGKTRVSALSYGAKNVSSQDKKGRQSSSARK